MGTVKMMMMMLVKMTVRRSTRRADVEGGGVG